jgi:hypothetical protein
MSVKFCRDCKFSVPEKRSEWNLRCINEDVNSTDVWALSQSEFLGTSCRDERSKFWFGKCGMNGKKFIGK